METNVLVKHRLMRLSSISDGEAFGAYLRSQPIHLATTRNQLSRAQYSWLYPNELQRFVEQLGDPVGSLDDILAKNTLFPVLRRFLTETDIELLYELHVGNQRHLSYTGVTRRIGLSWEPGVCFECLVTDLGPTKLPFWRRDFLPSTIRFCGRHGTPVYRLCKVCQYDFSIRDRFSRPQATCPCGRRLVINRDSLYSRQEKKIAIGWSKLLDTAFAPHIGEQEIRNLTAGRATDLGLVRHGRVQWSRVWEIFDSSRLRALGLHIQFPFTHETFSRALKGVESIHNPICALYLLITLYSSWDAVESAMYEPHAYLREIRVQINDSPPERPASKKAAYARSVARSLARLPETASLYERLRAENPSLNHEETRRLLPPENRPGVTKERLKALGVNVKTYRTDTEYYAEQDLSAAALIEQRWREYIEADVDFRICATRLLWDHPLCLKHGDPELQTRIPHTLEALDKYEETAAQFRLRRLRSLCLKGQIPRVKPADVDQLDSMSERELMALMCHERGFRLSQHHKGGTLP